MERAACLNLGRRAWGSGRKISSGGFIMVKRRAFLAARVCLGLTAALGGCDTTVATPSSFRIAAANGSRLSGLAVVTSRCVEYNKEGPCAQPGSGLQLQFQTLHASRLYAARIQSGACGKPSVPLQSVRIYVDNSRPEDGLLGDAVVPIPIHDFLKGHYSVELYTKSAKRVVACGNLQTGRWW